MLYAIAPKKIIYHFPFVISYLSLGKKLDRAFSSLANLKLEMEKKNDFADKI
jgi:hypothetical protein